MPNNFLCNTDHRISMIEPTYTERISKSMANLTWETLYLLAPLFFIFPSCNLPIFYEVWFLPPPPPRLVGESQIWRGTNEASSLRTPQWIQNCRTRVCTLASGTPRPWTRGAAGGVHHLILRVLIDWTHKHLQWPKQLDHPLWLVAEEEMPNECK